MQTQTKKKFLDNKPAAYFLSPVLGEGGTMIATTVSFVSQTGAWMGKGDGGDSGSGGGNPGSVGAAGSSGPVTGAMGLASVKPCGMIGDIQFKPGTGLSIANKVVVGNAIILRQSLLATAKCRTGSVFRLIGQWEWQPPKRCSSPCPGI